MYCSNCGNYLSDDAKFCLNCGKDQKGYIEDDVWETCEITYGLAKGGGLFGNNQFHFIAKAIGPKGPYIAATSITDEQGAWTSKDDAPYSDNKRDTKAHNDLVTKLTSQGWQHVIRGPKWYDDRFRRRVK